MLAEGAGDFPFILKSINCGGCEQTNKKPNETIYEEKQ